MSRLLKSRFSRRALLLLTLASVIYLTLHGKQPKQPINSSDNARDARKLSSFYWIQHRRDTYMAKFNNSKKSWLTHLSYKLSNFPSDFNEPESRLLLNWDDTSRTEKCRYMIDATYLINPGWTNQLISRYTGQDLDDLLISLLGERLRIFNYCFTSTEDIKLQQVFDVESLLDPDNALDITPTDYMRRMFPFLRDLSAADEPLWPKVTDLRTGVTEKPPDLPEDFNVNFWSYWRSSAHGKGLVITLAESNKSLLFKQLRVLDHMKNDLPIQVVTKGTEFSGEFVEELSSFVKTTTQQVYLVDCATLLQPEFAEEFIVNVINKWIAVIFNTFEEMILLDVDAVPFLPLNQFLNEPNYKTNGMLLYKDRNMPSEHTMTACVDMLAEVEPSYQEKTLINTKLKFSMKQNKFDESEEAMIFTRFFHDMILHHVDSGLAVINKSTNLNGLLFSFMLNLDAKMRRCVYGDKEIFWLGQLFAGQTYSIYPNDGSIVGPLIEGQSDDDSQTIYQICSAQIAHTSQNGELLWTNGGLRTCKIINSAEGDFKKHHDYFVSRYDTVEKLTQIYDSPLAIEAVIIPETNKNPWRQLQECSGYIYCATATKDRNSQEKIGEMVHFDEKTLKSLTKIAQVWNES